MSYYLFLDDERVPAQVTWVAIPNVFYNVVRNYNEFVRFIEDHGVPVFVSFDHDLADEHYAIMLKDCQENNTGQLLFAVPENVKDMDYGLEKTGYDCAKWLVDYCADNRQKFPEFTVHSMNPIGANG